MIRKLLASVRQYKFVTLITPCLVLLEVAMEVAIPLIMADLIDNGITQGNMNEVVKMGVALLCAALLSMAFGACAGVTAARASSGFAANLRHDLFHHVQDFSFANIDAFATSSIITRTTTDITNIQNAYQMILRMGIRAPSMMILGAVMCFRIHAQLAMVFFAVLPILAVGMFCIVRRAYPLFNRVFKNYDLLNRVVQENLHGIRVVKSFLRQPHESEKFDKTSDDIRQDYLSAELTIAFIMPLMQLCMYGSMLLISWLGAQYIIACGGDAALGLSTGLLNSLILYAMQILMSLIMFSMFAVMIIMSRASMLRASEIMDATSTITSPENAIPTVQNGDIRFDDVCFSYADSMERLCLSHIDLHIQSGETIGILGATGAAKSTLVQLIPRLYDATSGVVAVGGVDVRDYDLNALRNAVAVVLQKNQLFSGTIADNLRWGNPEATDAQLVHACTLAQAHDFISDFPKGYDTHIEQGGTNVSGGQKQRLCIARALLKQPKILILDDSTSAVDTQTDAYIRQAMRNEIPNTTKLIIAQRVSSVADADRILVLDNGKIIAFDNHENLLQTCDIYREVHQSQQKGDA